MNQRCVAYFCVRCGHYHDKAGSNGGELFAAHKVFMRVDD